MRGIPRGVGLLEVGLPLHGLKAVRLARPSGSALRPRCWLAHAFGVARPIEAEYRGGALHPTRPLSLKDGERVRLVVVRQSDPARWNLEKLSAPNEDTELAEAGLETWADDLDALDKQ